MYVYRNIKLGTVFTFAWKNLLIFTIWGGLITWLQHYFEHHGQSLAIPFLPISTIGIAVAFYLGFKNNQSYDRFWEARKIWGGIVNYSRTWGNQVLSYVTDRHLKDPNIDQNAIKQTQKRLVYRHIGWMNALRLQLRKPASHSIDFSKSVAKKHYKGRPGGEDWIKDVAPFVSCNAEKDELMGYKNTATQLIRLQGEDLKELERLGLIEDFRHMDMMSSLEEFYNLQGKCERIKNTPLPRQYSYFSHLFVWIFIIMMPFGLVGEFLSLGHSMIWLTIPCYVLISWIFITMENIGDNSEDPFENFINDVPMTALCRTIEIDLREMLGEKDLPPKIEAVNGVLM